LVLPVGRTSLLDDVQFNIGEEDDMEFEAAGGAA
jgi:hypothetical protein